MLIDDRLKNGFDKQRHLNLEKNCKTSISQIRWEIALRLGELHPEYSNDKIYFIVKKYIRDNLYQLIYNTDGGELTVIIDGNEINFSGLLQARFPN